VWKEKDFGRAGDGGPGLSRSCDNLTGVLRMETSRLSTKGRIARAASFQETDLEEVAGCLRYKGKAKTVAQMKAAIAREVVRRHRGGRY